MKCNYHDALKPVIHKQFYDTRKKLNFTQSKMAERLNIDVRSYADIDHGKSMCSSTTLLLFLLYCCPDLQNFFEEVRTAVEGEQRA